MVIPVLNAAEYLPELFEALFAQEPFPPDEVLLVDSMSTDDTVKIAEGRPGVTVIPIEEFSHGRARNLGARWATGDIVVLMTQDALPADRNWLAQLVEPLNEEGVVASYSRQVPRGDATPMERYFLQTHFPPGAARRRRVGDEELTLRKVFFSNVSAAIRRSILEEYPFEEDLIMSEDQQLSRDLLAAGYTVAYRPSSVVYHSHRYTLWEVFRRYFDSVYSLTVVFPRHDMERTLSMGSSYFLQEMRHMLRRHPLWLPYYAGYAVAKASGTIAGHYAMRLPLSLRRWFSLHRYHWRER